MSALSVIEEYFQDQTPSSGKEDTNEQKPPARPLIEGEDNGGGGSNHAPLFGFTEG